MEETTAQHPPAVSSCAVLQNPDALFITWTPEWRTERLAEGFGATSLLPAPFARKWPWPVRYLTQAIATTWHLVRRRPQLVSFQNPPPLTGLVLVLLSHVLRFDVWADCHSGPWMDPRWMRFDRLNRWVLARCRGGLFHNLEMLAEHGHQTPEAILSWTPPLRDLHDPAVAAAARSYPYVVMVCSYHPDEPTEEVLAAARLMPDVPFMLTGNAPDEFRAGAPDNVTFTGFLSVPDYWKLVQGAATILCLTKYPKTMQQGIAEGLEAGVFGVSSDTQTMRDWRADTETCDLVDWRDPAAIANAVSDGVERNRSYDHAGRERLLARSHEQFQAFVNAAQTTARP
jgi:glycosyltransferase involved in cell wall biosynthesis